MSASFPRFSNQTLINLAEICGKGEKGHFVIFLRGNLYSQRLASADTEDVDLSKLPHRPSGALLP